MNIKNIFLTCLLTIISAQSHAATGPAEEAAPSDSEIDLKLAQALNLVNTDPAQAISLYGLFSLEHERFASRCFDKFKNSRTEPEK